MDTLKPADNILTMSTRPDPLENVLVYEQLLPFQWQPFRPKDRDFALAEINTVNEQLLLAILCMDDHPREIEEGAGETLHEIQRLEAKLDLLLRWVGQTLSTSLDLPDKRMLHLSENGLAVEIPEILTVGEEVLIRVCLMTGFPEPLQLAGVVFSSVQTADGALTTIAFDGLSDEVRDQIEKFIFRKHRRMVALKKKQSA